ncbi:MAG TPA: flagellar hook-basal body complex protein FliE [Armatimonadota bacterium]|jgi:flagellar hook-basal body complex protein FliE
MTIQPISDSIGSIGSIGSVGGGTQGSSDPVASFADTLKGALEEVNKLEQTGDEQARLLAEGKAKDLHQVMLSLEESKTAVQLLVQTRNKVLEAYQEIIKTQV